MNDLTHILYADDDDDDHVFFKEAMSAIKNRRCQVTSAYNGAEVLDLLIGRGRYKDNGPLRPDILILDLNMPVIDGYGILRELRQHQLTRDLPVYILSVSDKKHDIDLCRQLGCTDFYTKPVNFSMLTKVIEKILAADQGEKSA